MTPTLNVLSTGSGKSKFAIAEGEPLEGPILPTSNTNTHGRFQPDVRTCLRRSVAEGPTHDFALGVGHRSETLRRIGAALGIDRVIVNQEKRGC